MRNVLLVYPKFPPSFWGHKYALELIDKKASMPPLGLLTIAAMFPKSYMLKLIDMNIEPLTDGHLGWADLVLTSSMIVQQHALREVIARCNKAHKIVVAGGPYPTIFFDEIENVDHFVLGEVEETLNLFLQDFEAGKARHCYGAPKERPDVALAPIARFDLVNMRAYHSMPLQFARGCPYKCDFCDIWKLYGNLPRTKSVAQVEKELDALYNAGWRGQVFFVDDNFIGNWKEALAVLKHVERWQARKGFPFCFDTEASVNLGLHDELVEQMVRAGFDMVFIGLETPNPEALRLMKKNHNVKKDDPDYLLHAVHKLQRAGLEVTCGLIAGVDGDDEGSFDRTIEFVEKTGIATAMYGLLSAIKDTDLYDKLKAQDRLLEDSSGNNTDVLLNFKPQIDPGVLIAGYKRVLATLYDETMGNYFRRSWTLVKRLKVRLHWGRESGRLTKEDVVAGFRLFRILYDSSAKRPTFLRFLAKTLLLRPWKISLAMRLAAKGYDHERHTREVVLAMSAFKDESQKLFSEYRAFVADCLHDMHHDVESRLYEQTARLLRHVGSRVENLRECKESARAYLDVFCRDVNECLAEAKRQLVITS